MWRAVLCNKCRTRERFLKNAEESLFLVRLLNPSHQDWVCEFRGFQSVVVPASVAVPARLLAKFVRQLTFFRGLETTAQVPSQEFFRCCIETAGCFGAGGTRDIFRRD